MIKMETKQSKTKTHLYKIHRQCSELRCNDPSFQKFWSCKVCRLSDKYKRLSGVRIEELGCELFRD